MPKHIEAFAKILEKVGNFTQKEKLTFPSVDDYKKQLAIILNVIFRGKKGIVVYADYDADGALAGVQATRFLQHAFRIIRGDEYVSKVRMEHSDRQNSFGLTKEEFNRFMEDSDLVITVDNGSDITFHSDDLNGKLVVVDHHPSKNRYPYILNPNTGNRKDHYSTSGGRVVFDLLKHLDIILKAKVPEYKKVDNTLQFETLKVLAACTLVSDMAILDKENRAFISGAMESARYNKNTLPLYTKLDQFNQHELSFNVISLINAMGRMEELKATLSNGKNVLETWIAPSDIDEWREADAYVENVNKRKKKVVTKHFNSFLKNNSSFDAPVYFEYLEGAPIGITGLIANKISSKINSTPTVIGAMKNDGSLVFSGRGKDVKDIILDIFEGKGGGHQDAAGGKMDILTDAQTTTAVIEERIDKFIKAPENKDFFTKERIAEVVSERPLSANEIYRLQGAYFDICGSVGYYKGIKAVLDGHKVHSHHTYKSGWAIVELKHKAGGEGVIKLLFDTNEFSIASLEEKNAVLLLEFNSDGSLSLDRVMDKETAMKATKLIEEAKELGAEIISNEIEKEENVSRWYYAHPESGSAWETDKELGMSEYDGLVEEISKEEFEQLKTSGEWDISTEIEWEEVTVEEIPKQELVPNTQKEIIYEEIPEDKATEYKIEKPTMETVAPSSTKTKEDLISDRRFIPTSQKDVYLVKMYDNAIVEAYPDVVFVFGDNMESRGKGGQAVIRDSSNAFGIPTKNKPSMNEDAFFSDKQGEQVALVRAINFLYEKKLSGKTIVLPYDGLGTGRAQMEKKSPKLFAIMTQLLQNHFVPEYGAKEETVANKGKINDHESSIRPQAKV